MSDKELLEWAAKAAGIEVELYENDFGEIESVWNPLTGNDDALRLAVKLRMRVDITADGCLVDCAGQVAEVGDDPYAATRRAIVRAAAEIGRNME